MDVSVHRSGDRQSADVRGSSGNLRISNVPALNPYSIRMISSEQSMSDIQEKIQDELQQARAACDVNGSTSPECAAAWDAVEELQSEAAHQRQAKPKKNSLEVYCDDNPEAAECRIYED